MAVKIINSSINLNVNLETVIGEFKFITVWDAPGATWETVCISKPHGDTLNERALKELLTAFKEAKSQFAEKINQLEEAVKPFVELLYEAGKQNE